MRVLIFVLLFASCQASSFQKAIPQKENTQGKENESKQRPSNSPGTSIGKCVGCFDVQEQGTQQQQQAPYDAGRDPLYRDYLRFAIGGVFVALIGLIVLICQTIATRDSAKAAKASADNLIRTERAWIQVKFESRQQLSLFQPPPGMLHFWFWPEIINVGNTLARVTKIVVRRHEIERADKHFPGPPFLPDIPQYDSPESEIFEKERFVAPGDSIAPFPVPADIEIIERITSKEFSVYLYGYLKYLDASDTERETRFCYLYWIPYGTGDPNAEGFYTPGIAPPEYTKST